MSSREDLHDDVDSRIVSTARSVIEREAQALTAVPAQIGPDFARIVQHLLALEGKVVTTGTGTSGIMAERLAHLLAVSGNARVLLALLGRAPWWNGSRIAVGLRYRLLQGRPE